MWELDIVNLAKLVRSTIRSILMKLIWSNIILLIIILYVRVIRKRIS
jgi:hypothetical protein